MRFARTGSVSVAIGLMGALAIGMSGTAAGGAAPASHDASIAVSPSSGPPGSGFQITFSDFGTSSACPTIQFYWNDQQIGSVPAQSRGSLSATVPATAKTGPHVVSGRNACTRGDTAVFIVVPGRAVSSTTQPGPSPTTTKSPTTTRPRSSKATTTETTTTETTSVEATSGRTLLANPGGKLIFDKSSVQAGEPLSATGTGCTPQADVTLTANGERVGAATADATGAFTTPVEFTRIQPGRQVVTANCGIVLTGSVDLNLTTSSSGNTGTLVVLAVFLLAAATLVARTRNGALW